MSIELSMLVPHAPSLCHEDKVPDFQQNIVAGLKEVAKEIAQIKPDVIVLVSCHWPSTFAHYVDCNPVHKGLLTAQEAPDMITDVPYNYPGDENLGKKLVEAGKAANIPVEGVYGGHFEWDYGTVVPLRYLVPKEDIPVINLSVTLAANIEETYKWGQVIAKVLQDTKEKVVFVSSGALSHNLVRGRHNMPTLSEHALNKEFLDLIMNKNYHAAYQMLPQFSSIAKVESGGRHVAMLLGVIDIDCTPVYYADGQSSGSWNPLITFSKNKVSSLK
ncbi:extradiol ring-cleavage dioxygenase [Neobacillus sp. MER 74]|uniref:DODA-type extradiol aromatic ring-opening family dioxygenase n=1 Tax=Bacillaceae TaxID=186817 RepID=UPI000BF65FCD|nr:MULTISPECIES: extradiol ring-cleavage dioxygenase [Bacillaceae]MCM3116966.1 extradiol ring-cleavage dioxygenase [Neobacillus sp. MER 74]PFP24752.1 extradiol ring-cleavage dioxygenase [Bacillus sp. AFS073361]